MNTTRMSNGMDPDPDLGPNRCICNQQTKNVATRMKKVDQVTHMSYQGCSSFNYLSCKEDMLDGQTDRRKKNDKPKSMASQLI